MIGGSVLKNKTVGPRRHTTGGNKRSSLVHKQEKLNKTHCLNGMSQRYIMRAELLNG